MSQAIRIWPPETEFLVMLFDDLKSYRIADVANLLGFESVDECLAELDDKCCPVAYLGCVAIVHGLHLNQMVLRIASAVATEPRKTPAPSPASFQPRNASGRFCKSSPVD